MIFTDIIVPFTEFLFFSLTLHCIFGIKIKNMETKHSDKRLLAGVIIILAGALVLAGNFLIDKDSLLYNNLYTWEMIVIGVGVIALVVSENKGTGIALIAVGGAFYLYRYYFKLHYQEINFWHVFIPAMLIIIGLLLILRRRGFGIGDKEMSELGDDFMDDVAIFGGGDKVISSSNFKGGRITAIFGGSNLDMTAVKLAEGPQYIDILAIFGGMSLIVPEDWDIKVQVMSIFGGFSDKHRISKAERESKNMLIIKGLAIFGGGEIKSY
jgi:predicted membrane protein